MSLMPTREDMAYQEGYDSSSRFYDALSRAHLSHIERLKGQLVAARARTIEVVKADHHMDDVLAAAKVLYDNMRESQIKKNSRLNNKAMQMIDPPMWDEADAATKWEVIFVTRAMLTAARNSKVKRLESP